MFYLKLATLCFIVFSQANASSNHQENKVLASRLESITLHNGQQTSSRRVSPIPQLRCIGGDAKGFFEVQSMRCRAQGAGYDSNDIQWTCTADVPEYFKLGSTQVLCEGYDHAEDPYILKGSCGVEYRLMFTEKGLFKYRERISRERHPAPQNNSKGSWEAFLFGVIFIIVACFIVSGMIRQWWRNREEQRRDPPGMNQGLDDNDGRRLPPPHFDDANDDPPPPYDDDDDQGQDFQQKKTFEKSPKAQSSADSQTQDAGIGSSSSGSISRQDDVRIATGAAVVAGAGAAAAVATHAYRRSTETQSPAETRNRGVPSTRTTNVYISTNDSWSGQSQESIGFGGTTRR